jgi:hypothetical protein
LFVPRGAMFKAETLSFVKDQFDYHQRNAVRLNTDPVRCNRHNKISEQFDSLLKEMQALQIAPPKPLSNTLPFLGKLRIGNIDELPPELRSQIKISESDQLELDIIEAITRLDGAAAVDEILVGLWRLTNRVQERDFLARKLYRMSQADMIHSVPKRKSYYALGPLPEGSSNGDDEQAEEFP